MDLLHLLSEKGWASYTPNVVQTLVFYSQLPGLNRHWINLVHPLSVNYFFHSRNKVGPIVPQHYTNVGNQQSISYIGPTFNRSSQSAECHDFYLGSKNWNIVTKLWLKSWEELCQHQVKSFINVSTDSFRCSVVS